MHERECLQASDPIVVFFDNHVAGQRVLAHVVSLVVSLAAYHVKTNQAKF